MAMAWESSSYSYHREVTAMAAEAAAFVDPTNAAYGAQTTKSARFKQETAELDAGAAALLQYSTTHLVELPQLESPSAPLAPNRRSQAASSADEAVDSGSRRGKKKARADAATDWRALDKFVASQLSPVECLEATAAGDVGSSSHCGEEDDDMAALLFLNSDGREEAERWTGLLGPAAGDGDFGLCVFEK
nr:unnamed protein product [Digitaria exilis]